MGDGDTVPSGAGRAPAERNPALELVRITEVAALAAGRWAGRGDEDAAESAAARAVDKLIASASIHGTVVIYGGAEGVAPTLGRGARVGDGTGSACDVAVDAVDGITLLAKGMPNAIAVLAMTERGAMYDPAPVSYMEKLAVGPEYADVVDIDRPVAENLRAVAAVKGTAVSNVTVTVLDRPRHRDLVQEIRETGARVHLIDGGDVAGAVAAARPGTGVDVLLGIGGAPEGVIAAAALTCLGGSMQARLWPRDADESDGAADAGHELTRVLRTDDLVRGGNTYFCATGVTDGDLLRGAHYRAGGATTQSLVMRSSTGTVRVIEGVHQLRKLREYFGVDVVSRT